MHSLRNKAVNLLRSTESWFKIDMVYLVKGSFWTTLSFLISTLSSLIVVTAYGNLLSRETYGTYNYLLSLGASLSFLTLSGAGIAVLRAVARGYENIVPATLRLQLKYNLIASAMVLVGAIYYGYKGNMLFAYSLALLSIANPIAEAFHIHVQVLTARKRFDLLTKYSSIVTFLSTFATVIALLLTKSILVLIVIYSISGLLPNIIVYLWVTKNIDKTPPEEEQLDEMRRTTFHMTGAGLIGIAAQYIDKIMLFQVAGPASLAVYGFAIAGPEKLKSLLKNWLTIAVPKLAQSSLTEIRRVVYQRIGISILIGSSLALAYILSAPFLFKLFLPRYLDSILYSQVQALSIIIAPITIYMGSIFASQNMLRGTYALSVGTQIIRIILFVIFGWFWNIWGFIFASLLSSLLSAIYGLIVWEIESKRLILKNEQGA